MLDVLSIIWIILEKILHSFESHLPYEISQWVKEKVFQKIELQKLHPKYLEKIKEFRLKEREDENCLDSKGQYAPPPLVLLKEHITQEEQEKIGNFQQKKGPAVKEPFEEAEKTHQTPISLRELVEGPHHRVAVVADSGMGKSTLLKELCLDISNGKIKTSLIPLYFEFMEYFEKKSLEALIEEKFKILAVVSSALKKYIEKTFSEGKFLFLIDGFDHLKDNDDAYNLLKEGGLLQKNRVIFASRPYAYKSLATYLKDFESVEARPLNDKQVRDFMGNWYENKTVKQIKTINPLLLRTPIFLSHIRNLLENNNLPEGSIQNASDLYNILINSLLKFTIQRPASPFKKITSDIDSALPHAIRLLSRLSYLTLEMNYPYSFPVDLKFELSKDKNMQDLGVDNHIKFEGLIHLGVFLKLLEETKNYTFRHQSFQEYLASLELKKQLFPACHSESAEGGRRISLTDENKELLRNYLEYNRWDEVLFFLIGSLDTQAKACGYRDNYAKEIILFIHRYEPILAGRCIAHYKGNKDEDFGKVIDKLFSQIHRPEVQETLAKIGTDGILTRLVGLLKDKDVRREAAYALGNIGSERAVELLIPLLSDKDEDVRWAAVVALGRTGSERAVEPLITLLKDEDVRRAAAVALGNIGSERAVDHLIPLLSDKDEDVRRAAAEALGDIGSERAVDHLIPLLEDEYEYVRREAAFALGKIGSDRAVEHLIPLLSDKDEDVRRAAAEALGLTGSERAVDHLIPLLKKDEHKYVRWAAAVALAKSSKRLEEDASVGLVERLHREGHDEAVDEIRKVQKRRFLRVLHPESPGSRRL